MANDDLQSKAADFVKKALTVGVGAIFLTEESLRGLVSEIKLPKEILTGILDSGARTRNEFLSKLSTELIEKIVAHELRNPVDLKFAPDGVRCTLLIPVRRRGDFAIRERRS